MRRCLRNLVCKVRLFLAWGRKQDANPVTRAAWELIPFNFETDWLVDNEPVNSFPHTTACFCYYCRVRHLWESGAASASDNTGFLP